MTFTLAKKSVFTVLDFETTGSVAGWPVEPWQIGVVRMRDGAPVSGETFESLFRISPDRPFNPLAPGRHAQLRDQLATAPVLAASWPVLADWLTHGPLVAHNIGTERTLLTGMAPLHRFGPWIDTLALTRHAYPSLPSKALNDVIPALGLSARLASLCPEREAHDALYDAFACAVLLEHLLSLPGWEQTTVENLSSVRKGK